MCKKICIFDGIFISMSKVDVFLNNMKNKLEELKMNEEDDNKTFSNFLYYFNDEFDKLSRDEKNSVLLSFERDRKLKDLLSNI